jgi:hypothetical protein
MNPELQKDLAELPYTFQSNVMVAMSDGTQLAANIFLPKTDGPFPVILMRTPYGKMDANYGEAKRYCAAGYAMVTQDCRGRGSRRRCSLAGGGCRLLRDDDLRRRMGEAGLARVSERFTVDRMVAETAAVYERVAGTRRAGDSARQLAHD